MTSVRHRAKRAIRWTFESERKDSGSLVDPQQRRPSITVSGAAKASHCSQSAGLCNHCSQSRRSIITASKCSKMVRRRHATCVLLACATALRPVANVRRRPTARHAEDGCEAAEGDVVVFALPETVDPPGTPGERRLGVVKAEMSCTAWVHPLVEQGADQGEDEVMLVEDEAFEEAVQVQGGIECIIDDVFYGQLPVARRRRRVRGHGRRVLDARPGPGARRRRRARVGRRRRAVDTLV